MRAFRQNSDPDHRRVGWQRGLGLCGALLLSLAGACFTGTGAEGLACDNDDDCGPSLTCDQNTGCCGGDCLENGTTSETTTSTSTSSTTDPTSSTTTDPTTSSTDPGTSTGPAPFCGDGNPDGPEFDEQCDLGTEPNAATYSECTPDCKLPPFLYAPRFLETEIPDPAWDDSASYVSGTLMGQGWGRLAMDEWGTGMQPPPNSEMESGIKGLVSSEFTIDAQQARLIMDHTMNFNQCGPDQYDGGRVYGRVVGTGEFFQIAPAPRGNPPGLFVDDIDTDQGCADTSNENPWAGQDEWAFVGTGMMERNMDEYAIPPQLLNVPIVLEFQAAFDCSYCAEMMMMPPPPNNWVIRSVVIERM